MPKPKTMHAVRVADDLWNEAMEIAKSRDETVTAVVTRSLRSYVSRYRTPEPEPDRSPPAAKRKRGKP